MLKEKPWGQIKISQRETSCISPRGTGGRGESPPAGYEAVILMDLVSVFGISILTTPSL